MREPSAAQALYGHLPSAAREPIKQSEPRLADALWPRPKPPTRGWSDRDALLRNLKELNQRIDARLQRERGR
jgi:hypothetical protein